MKRIVLIGASGTIGSKVKESFKDENYEVIEVRNKGEGFVSI